jgi:uncharacterized RDD family membrane protein YckC
MSEQNGLVRGDFADAGAYAWPEGSFDGVIWARALAYIADIVIVSILIFAATVVFAILGILTFGLLWPGMALSPLIALTYFTLTLGGPQSATPGMRWQGIELRTWDGRRPGYVQGALQTIVFYVTMTLTVFLLVVPFLNERRRCLHDYLCGTVVIRTRT